MQIKDVVGERHRCGCAREFHLSERGGPQVDGQGSYSKIGTEH